MTTPSGTITMTDIQTEFGGANPASLSEYYAGGGYVSAAVAGVPTSGTISMDDLRNKTQVYFGTLSPSIGSITEGGASVTFTLSGGTGITNGTYYWKVSGTNITTGDFVATTGSFTITSNTGSFSVTAVSDALIEGTESFTASIGVASGVPLAYVTSSSVNITETQTYGVVLGATSVNEGGSMVFRVDTTNVAVGTVLYFTLGTVSGTINSSDFTSSVAGAMSATTLVSGASCKTPDFTLTLANDLTTEGTESFNIQIHTGSVAGPVVATSGTVTINDTSLSPPTYSAAWQSPTIQDGSAVALVVNTTGVPNGTVLYYTTVGTMTSADMPMIASSTITINSNNSTVYHYKRFDGTFDAGKTLYVNVRTGSTAGPIVAGASVLTSSDAWGVINTGNATMSGTTSTYGASTNILIQITYINVYFEARTFQIWRDLNLGAGQEYTGVTLTVPAYGTSSNQVSAYYNPSATGGPVQMNVMLRCAGHADFYFGWTGFIYL